MTLLNAPEAIFNGNEAALKRLETTPETNPLPFPPNCDLLFSFSLQSAFKYPAETLFL